MARLEASSDQYAAQKIATILQTRLGDLPIRPSFGTTDPLFSEIDRASFYGNVAAFFPDIRVNEITEELQEDGILRTTVTFEQVPDAVL